MVVNTLERILESSSAVNPTELAYYGNRVLKANEKLISTLVKSTDTSDRVSFTLAAVEVEIFMVGPLFTLEKIPRLNTTNSFVDIDLIGIAKNNDERSAAVAFMSYNTMENLLKPDTSEDIVKTMMSTVISAILPKTTNTKLTKPVNFTFRHIREFDPSGSLSCVYWNISEWIVDGCSVLETNSSYTVCSCDHLSTFALMQISSHPPKSYLHQLTFVYVIAGLVFSLALLTIAICSAVNCSVLWFLKAMAANSQAAVQEMCVEDSSAPATFFVVEDGTALLGMDLISSLHLPFSSDVIANADSMPGTPVLSTAVTAPFLTPPSEIGDAVSAELDHLLHAGIIKEIDASA
ncbi:hypothetical protein QQF64_000476 [Cirrhinus molitorella]|uniref:GAIN-B domain-containing protein n=1 Tax=Cirrhinus molitorella TaxID=172907 RepID=A0ABR3NXA0_9TELE